MCVCLVFFSCVSRVFADATTRDKIVKFLDEHRAEGSCTKFAMNEAAAGGHLDVVKVGGHRIQGEGREGEGGEGAEIMR